MPEGTTLRLRPWLLAAAWDLLSATHTKKPQPRETINRPTLTYRAAGMQVEHVAASSHSAPASLKVHGQSDRIEARGGVVVAVEGPAAKQLLGDALAAEPSQAGPGVGTCSLYFRCGSTQTCSFGCFMV